jgi:hypothetical protein
VVEAGFNDLVQGHYTSNMAAKAAVQSIVAFIVRYKTAFMWAGSRLAAEYVTYSLLAKFIYELEKRFKQAVKAV